MEDFRLDGVQLHGHENDAYIATLRERTALPTWKASKIQTANDLAAAEDLSCTAKLRAEYPDRSVDFTLAYRRDAAGEEVAVLAPERIAGIRARVQPDSSALVYEGLILDVGPLDAYGLTPMSALPRLTETLLRGAVDSHWEEDGLHVYRLILDDHLSATVWFSEAMVPVRSELASDDNVCIFCELSEWSQ